MLFFREFRPIDSQQSSSHLFHPSTEEILLGGGVSACGLWLVLFCLLLGCLTWAPHGVRTGEHSHNTQESAALAEIGLTETATNAARAAEQREQMEGEQRKKLRAAPLTK